ncbi:MAG: thiamine diphosphokinase [Lachnospiraceae bacterium]|nr:thiamine diphosphokinase [Lachnospiraceae bacterium]
MKNAICYIIGAGENYGLDFTPTTEDFVIAADAGIRYLEQRGFTADLVIGDFDSLNDIPVHPNTKELNPEKDDTDMLAAVREGIKSGYSVFHIYCGMGGRIDHTIANIQILAYLSQNGMQGFLFGKDIVITAITNRKMSFNKVPSSYISVFSHTEKSEGVYLQGLKYELNNATLTNTFPLGVSNEFIGKEGSVSVAAGTLLIVFPKEALHKLLIDTV